MKNLALVKRDNHLKFVYGVTEKNKKAYLYYFFTL